MKEKHTDTLSKFSAELSKDLPNIWTTMISEWEHDKTQPNPYTHTEKGIALCFTASPRHTNSHLASKTAKVRKILAEVDRRDIQQGSAPDHQIPPSIFIRTGLEIEDQQYVFFVRVVY